jgi:hypothetical protein
MYAVAVVVAILALMVSSNAVSSLGGTYRSDHYLDNTVYPENVDPMEPTGGGRVHLILPRASTTTPQLPLRIIFADQDVTIIQDPGQTSIAPFEWIYAELDRTVPFVWLSFHTQNSSFVEGLTSVQVLDAANAVVAANTAISVPSKNYGLQITVITTQSNMNQAVIHVHNYGNASVVLRNLTVDSTSVTLNSTTTFAANQHRYYVQALPAPKQEGDLLFVQAETSDGEHIGTAARVTKEIFPIQVYPPQGVCPYVASGKTLHCATNATSLFRRCFRRSQCFQLEVVRTNVFRRHRLFVQHLQCRPV